jgi:hypothetical protein
MTVESFTFVNIYTGFDKGFFADIVCNYPWLGMSHRRTLSQFNRAAAHGSTRLPDDEFGGILAANAVNYAGFAD